jgi:hypothetical protein
LQTTAAGACGIGFWCGIALLAAANSLLVVLTVLAWLFLRDIKTARGSGLRFVPRSMVAAAVCAGVLAPYLYRNYTQVHPGVFLSLNSGINLLIGNSPGTRPDSGVEAALTRPLDKFAKGKTDYEANRIFTAMAIENIRSDPAHYTALYFRKVLHGFDNSAATRTLGRSPVKTAVLWSYALFVWGGFVLLLYGCWRGDRSIKRVLSVNLKPVNIILWVVAAAYVVNIAGAALFFTRIRFRMPGDILLAVFSAIGWYCVADRWLKFRASAEHTPK